MIAYANDSEQDPSAVHAEQSYRRNAGIAAKCLPRPQGSDSTTSCWTGSTSSA